MLEKIYSERSNKYYSLELNTFNMNEIVKNHSEFRHQKDGDSIVVLIDNTKREVTMSNSAMEVHTNKTFIDNAKGDILIAGLSIGMIVLAIQDKPQVNNITIVEKDPNLVDFIMEELNTYLNHKVTIVIEDINKYITKEKYDVIYFDIWNDISAKNLNEMENLMTRFNKNLKDANSRISCWRYTDTVELTNITIKIDAMLEDYFKEKNTIGEK